MVTIDADRLGEQAREAFALGERGDLSDARACRGALRLAATDVQRAWALALSAQATLRGTAPLEVVVSDLSALASRSGGEAHVALAHASVSLARLAALRFDAPQLSQICGLHTRLVRGGDALIRATAPIVQGWWHWLEPGAVPMPDLERAYRDAREAAAAALLIEAQALRALIHLNAGELDAATTIARRASRMARSEGIPDAEVLANLVLARVRRHQNRPHLALHILGAVTPFAPPAWDSWLSWEAALAGGPCARPPGASAGLLAALIEAIRGARDDDALKSATALMAESTSFPVRSEAERAIALLVYPDAPVSNPEVDAWRHGEVDEVPAGLGALAFLSASSGSPIDPVARLVVHPDGAASRIAEVATSSVVARWSAATAPSEGNPQPRVDHGLAILALRGTRPFSNDEYFGKLYGYAYEAAVHSSMLNVHVMRMRERLGGHGDIVRDNGGIHLVVHRTVVLRDPACAETFAQRALRALAQHGGLSARDLASRMKVPLRTAQRTLKQLVADGASIAGKRGRAVVYEVEDTTFSEPTRSRRFDAGQV